MSHVPKPGMHRQGASVTWCDRSTWGTAAETTEVRNVPLLLWEHVAGEARKHV